MRMEIFRLDPIQQMGLGIRDLNGKLEGAIHVETATRNEGRFGGDHTITIFAFYPDAKEPRQPGGSLTRR